MDVQSIIDVIQHYIYLKFWNSPLMLLRTVGLELDKLGWLGSGYLAHTRCGIG